jgi:hypothetical protein
MFYLVGLVCNGPEGTLVSVIGMQKSFALSMHPDRIANPVSPDPRAWCQQRSLREIPGAYPRPDDCRPGTALRRTSQGRSGRASHTQRQLSLRAQNLIARPPNGHWSLLSFRFPQCVSLREESNIRSTFRFNALMTSMRANIVGLPTTPPGSPIQRASLPLQPRPETVAKPAFRPRPTRWRG